MPSSFCHHATTLCPDVASLLAFLTMDVFHCSGAEGICRQEPCLSCQYQACSSFQQVVGLKLQLRMLGADRLWKKLERLNSTAAAHSSVLPEKHPKVLSSPIEHEFGRSVAICPGTSTARLGLPLILVQSLLTTYRLPFL